jgi:tetratricopeptide (TPR) repeat protein
MASVLNIIAIGLSAIFISIPLFNQYVFHTVNIDEIIVEGRDGIAKIRTLQNEGKLQESIDSARALIDEFRNDSCVFFSRDIVDWNRFITALSDSGGSFPYRLLAENRESKLSMALDTALGGRISRALKCEIVTALNEIKNDPYFVVLLIDSLRSSIAEQKEIEKTFNSLKDKKIIYREDGELTVDTKLAGKRARQVQKFHMAVIGEILFPGHIKKDYHTGRDWASEYIVQTAYFFIGNSYHYQFAEDRAIEIFDSLVALYPKTIYAEALFLQIGQMLFTQGKNAMAQGDVGEAEARFHQSIEYLEKIERNREVARRFPKYKYADLQPGRYVNVDVASRAKQKRVEETKIYTTKKAKEELEGKDSEDRSGYTLEDAIKLIGESYIQLGETDSARQQFGLILDFFPESDNLDDAQKLIADSYVKEGDLLLKTADSTDTKKRKKSMEYYGGAVEEYLKFVNVYPQSDLITDVYISLGDVYNKMGRAQEASVAFESALGRAKDAEEQARVQLEIGNYYKTRERFGEAIEAYQVILNNFLSTEVAPNAQYLLGECYEDLQDTAKALEAYNVILEHYRNNSSFFPVSALKAGNIHFERGNYKLAREAYKVGYSLYPDENLASKLQFQIGMVWRTIADNQEGEAKSNALESAVGQFQVVVDRFEGTADADRASFQITECYMELGKEDAAREASKNIQSRDLRVSVIKIFGVDAQSYEEEITYWTEVYDEALEEEERVSALYEKALVFANKLQQYDSAMAIYEQIIERTGKPIMKINAKVGISRIYMARAEFAKASELLEDLLKDRRVKDNLRRNLEIQLYEAYYKSNELDKAQEGYEEFVAQFPENDFAPYAIYKIGLILADKEKHKEAIDKFQVVLDKYPNCEYVDEAVLGIGNQKVSLGDYAEAVAYLEKFVSANPDVSSAVHMYLKIGEVYQKHLENNQKARDTYQKIVEKYPDDDFLSYAAYQLGMVYKSLERDKSAMNAFEKVKKEKKAIYRAAQAEIAKIIAKTDPEKAIENYKRIVRESDTPEDSARATIGIGDVYASMKKYPRAAESYKTVFDFYTGADTSLIAGAIVKWVDALFNSQQFKRAIEVADIMQKRYPDNPYTINTYYFEGTSYFSLKRYFKAREQYLEIIKQDKSPQLTEVAYYQKAESYYFASTSPSISEGQKAKYLKTAINEYSDYIKTYPKGQFTARAYYMQGNCYWSLEDWNNAQTKFRVVVERYPGFPDICNAKNFLAYSLNKTDRWKEAMAIYTEVKKTNACGTKEIDFAKEQYEMIVTQH